MNFFSKLGKSEDTRFLYPMKDSLTESNTLKPALINIKESGFPFLITRDFIVKEESEGVSRKSKTFYQIYEISATELNNEEQQPDNNLIQKLNPLQLGIQSFQYENNIIENCFKNHMNLFENFDWTAPIIAASITIVDKNKVFTFREFDISDFFQSILRKDTILNLNNSQSSKRLWIHLFNFIFKSKNILVPSGKDDLENYSISWTIVFETCDVLEGSDITPNLTK